MKRIVFTLLLSWFLNSYAFQGRPVPGTAVVISPDGKLKAMIQTKGRLSYHVLHENDTVIAPSNISMKLADGTVLGGGAAVKSTRSRTVNNEISSPFYKRKSIVNHYNELVISFKGDYSVTFRAYNEGLAYRFSTARDRGFYVENEVAEFNFNADYTAIVPYVKTKKEPVGFEEQFFNSFENTYTTAPLSKLNPNRLAFLPLVVDVKNGKKVCITESDLESYPGMYLNSLPKRNALHAVFAPLPDKTRQGGHNKLQELVTSRMKYIAECMGTRNFPWRVMAISSSDKQLADNDLVYKLAAPSRVKDISWIKPGKVAWDWWNDWNISGVDFKSGVNNQTYKYYIDFASKYGMEYVILDEGWSVNLEADLMQVVPEIDIKDLVDYGRERNVGIILWAGYFAFNKDIDGIARHYADLGVKGFKVDFMDRDDQAMLNFYYRAAEAGAKHKLLMDFHGAFKPTGLNRTYPNVLNFEGVHGLEQMKWSDKEVDQVTYDVTVPFIRMLAGPMDYTQGAMRNSIKKNYFPAWSDPMSQGTRCRQLAEYVIFEAPLNMLCDNPSNYYKEPECTEFISAVPEIWDQTIALNGEIGKYVTIARQKGEEWYVGSITNWDERELDVNLSFIGNGSYKAEIFKDGFNADKNATDYKREIIDVPADRHIILKLAPGGGFAARIFKTK